jgi:hypothetical protein
MSYSSEYGIWYVSGKAGEWDPTLPAFCAEWVAEAEHNRAACSFNGVVNLGFVTNSSTAQKLELETRIGIGAPGFVKRIWQTMVFVAQGVASLIVVLAVSWCLVATKYGKIRRKGGIPRVAKVISSEDQSLDSDSAELKYSKRETTTMICVVLLKFILVPLVLIAIVNSLPLFVLAEGQEGICVCSGFQACSLPCHGEFSIGNSTYQVQLDYRELGRTEEVYVVDSYELYQTHGCSGGSGSSVEAGCQDNDNQMGYFFKSDVIGAGGTCPFGHRVCIGYRFSFRRQTMTVVENLETVYPRIVNFPTDYLLQTDDYRKAFPYGYMVDSQGGFYPFYGYRRPPNNRMVMIGQSGMPDCHLSNRNCRESLLQVLWNMGYVRQSGGQGVWRQGLDPIKAASIPPNCRASLFTYGSICPFVGLVERGEYIVKDGFTYYRTDTPGIIEASVMDTEWAIYNIEVTHNGDCTWQMGARNTPNASCVLVDEASGEDPELSPGGEDGGQVYPRRPITPSYPDRGDPPEDEQSFLRVWSIIFAGSILLWIVVMAFCLVWRFLV